MRLSWVVGGQTRWRDTGWWGGAGRTVGDRHPRLWCAWGSPLFAAFARDCARRIPHRTRKELQPCGLRVAPCCESRSNGPGIVHATLY
eukprot:5106336-Prymnesium_polylepis.1